MVWQYREKQLTICLYIDDDAKHWSLSQDKMISASESKMSSASESSQGYFPDISVSLIVVTNVGDYMNRRYDFAGYGTSFHAIKNIETNPNATACILVVRGYSDLCEPESLGQWMAEDDQLRSVVNQYLAPAGQRY